MATKVGMLHSMTGFGHAQVVHGEYSLSCELSSLNHRYFDLNFYAPPFLMKFEALVRGRVNASIKRGRLRLNLHLTGTTDPAHRLRFCEENLREYLRAWDTVRASLPEPGELRAAELLTAPFVLTPTREEFDSQEWKTVLERLVDASIERLDGMRRTEGGRLAEDLQRRVKAMRDMLGRIEARAPLVRQAYRARLDERLREWELDSKMTEDRIQSELFCYCERADITEETVRTHSHLKQFEESLAAGGAVGRRLVFIAQEINREATTIGAKANDTEIGREVVLFKEELAKVREQIENIE